MLNIQKFCVIAHFSRFTIAIETNIEEEEDCKERHARTQVKPASYTIKGKSSPAHFYYIKNAWNVAEMCALTRKW